MKSDKAFRAEIDKFKIGLQEKDSVKISFKHLKKTQNMAVLFSANQGTLFAKIFV